MIKRLLDIFISFIGLLVTFPVTLVVMALLAIESPRHIFYAQWRLGRFGKPFRMYKFRKFPVAWRDAGPGVTVSFDSRMTWLGGILERTKVDELPQLWNILKGEMSIAGPRPESLKFKELFTGRYAAVLDFKPGIFGPNQIRFRNEAELYPPDVLPETFYRESLFPQKAECDLTYFQKANLFSDLLLILNGVWVTLSGIINWKRFIGLHLKILIADVLLIEAAYLIAHMVRYSGLPPGREWDVFQYGLLFLPPFMITGMALCGCYRNPVSFFFIPDALRLSFSISVLWLTFFVILFSLRRDLSLYLIPLVWVFLLVFITFPRVAARVFWEQIPLNPSRPVTSRVIVYGAGKLGQALAGMISSNNSGIDLVGFIDDEPQFRGRRINGFEVIGRESDLPTIHSVHKFSELWVTFAPDEIKSKRMYAFCHKHQVKMILLTELDPFSRMFAG